METTDRITERAIVVVRRIDVATAAEAQAVRAVAERRGRPIVAEATDIVQPTICILASTPPTSKSVTAIYGLTYDWSNVEIPDNIAPYVTFNHVTRTLTFDNTATVSLFEDVVVKIELHIAHTWGTDDAILEITFPKNAE